MSGGQATRKWYPLALVALCAVTVLGCIFLYYHDNKYTANGPQPMNGMLLLDEADLDDYPVLFLVDGWEYYGGRLLSPQDFAEEAPILDEYVFVGQYGGMEREGNAPHGSASYRLNISIPSEPATYMLELPEIFSSYRLYINGVEVDSLGNPDPADYAPQTGNKRIAIEATDTIEILIAASDYSHLYSGMVYPPAFGVPDAVMKMADARLLLRGIVCAAALTIGGLSLLIGFLNKRNMQAILYGLLCVFFIGYISYPIVRTFTYDLYPFYAIENLSFCAMLTVVLLLIRSITGKGKFDIGKHCVFFGVAMCIFTVAVHALLSTGNLYLMRAYSYSVTVYEWVVAGYLTFAAIVSVYKGSMNSRILLAGLLVFDCTLVMDRLLTLYEPILSGWFIELSSFVLVISIGITTGRSVARQLRNTVVLTERAQSMEHLYEMQRAYYSFLRDQIHETQTARHDQRHHFVVLGSYLDQKKYGELASYIAQYYDSMGPEQNIYQTGNEALDVLSHYYGSIARKSNIALDLAFDMASPPAIPENDLTVLFSNLLENAIESCLRQQDGPRFVDLKLSSKDSSMTIRIQNSTDGNIAGANGLFPSSKAAGRSGFGLESVKSIVKKYNGDAEFTADNEKRIFCCAVLLFW